jgi:probable phosphoglycerate mutase
MPKIAFARHCLTDWNALGRIQGHSDIPLNALGREQAEALADKIEQTPECRLRWVITSDLGRAQETASAVARRFKPVMSIRLDPRFRELHFGSLEGMTRREIISLHGDELLNIGTEAAQDFQPHGGENRALVLERQLKALAKYKEELNSDDESIQCLIIGHGRSLGILMDHFKQPYKLSQGDFQVVTI